MLTIFRHSLRRSIGQMLGWGLALGVLAGYLVQFYDTLAVQKEQLEQLLRSYPPELMAIFGDSTAMFTPEGYLGFEFFSLMPLVLGVFAVTAGSSLLAGDEESGILDLLLAYPLSRAQFFLGRLLAFLATHLVILGFTWVGFMSAMGASSLGLSGSEMLRPFASLLAALLFFGMLALMLSQWLPSARVAGTVSGLGLVASFFMVTLARLDENLRPWAEISPLHYYQGGEALLGLNGEWLALLLAGAALFGLSAWWRFLRRDIRVAGEGGWQLSLLWRRAAASK